VADPGDIHQVLVNSWSYGKLVLFVNILEETDITTDISITFCSF